MTLDVKALRADTPATETLLHFNNAGAGLMPRPVLEALSAHLVREATVGGYEAAAFASDALAGLYDAAARAVGGKPCEIAYAENATRAWDMVFYAFDWAEGDAVITCRSEYSSNMIAYLQMAERRGIEIRLAPDDESGAVDPKGLEALIDDKVKLISITHIPTNDGLVNPVAAIGAIAEKHGIPYLLDACQSVGQMPIDARAIGATMLSTTGRKYQRGPRGTGFLWVAEEWIDRLNPPFLDLHSADWVSPGGFKVAPDAKRFENWESYIAGRIGLAVALDYMADVGIEAIWDRIKTLSSQLRDELRVVPGITVHDQGTEKCGIVTFSSEGKSAADISTALRQDRINTSTTSVQVTRQALLDQGVTDMVRASVHAYNTEDEIARFVEALKRVL